MLKWLRSRALVICIILSGAVFLIGYDEEDVYGTVREAIGGWRQTVYPQAAERIETWYGDSRERLRGEPSDGLTVDRTGELRSERDGEDEGAAVGDRTAESEPEIQQAGRGTQGNDALKISGMTAQEAIAQDPITRGTAAQESIAGESEENDGVTYVTVEDDYFADALFIGDSRTVGLLEYGELEDIATFYASTGLTVFGLHDNKAVKLFGHTGKHTISEYLEEREYGKIYLMVGLNEMGTGDIEYYIKKYGETLDMIREAQPDAIIYVQAIIKLTARQAEREAYVTNEELEERNERLAEFADNERIFFLDVNPELCVEDGGLNPEYTSDGTHLKAQYISIWKDFLKCHAVEIPKKYQTLQPF